MRFTKLDFSGHNIFAGIDVHKKSWSVHIVSDAVEHGSFTLPPDPQKLVTYLKKQFPGATYHSVYHRSTLRIVILSINERECPFEFVCLKNEPREK